LGHPLGVVDIGFASRHRLDGLGIDQQHPKFSFQAVEDRFPLPACALDCPGCHCPSPQPIRQPQQLLRQRPKAPYRLLPPPRLGGRNPTRHPTLLMQVQPGTMPMHPSIVTRSCLRLCFRKTSEPRLYRILSCLLTSRGQPPGVRLRFASPPSLRTRSPRIRIDWCCLAPPVYPFSSLWVNASS
jgi:hypothetical protein